MVLLADLICDERTQVRAAEDTEAIKTYAEAISNGATFPRPVVFRDDEGQLWIADGHHTVKAHALLKRERIKVEVRLGSAKDARMYAYTTNLTHGVPLTLEDKRKIVEGLIRDTGWKDRKIAEQVRFWSHEKVRQVRLQMAGKAPKKSKAAAPANGWQAGEDEKIDGAAENGVVNVAEAIDLDAIVKAEAGVTIDHDEVSETSVNEAHDAITWEKYKAGPAMAAGLLEHMAKEVIAEAATSTFAWKRDDKTRTLTVAVKHNAVITTYHCRVLMECVTE